MLFEDFDKKFRSFGRRKIRRVFMARRLFLQSQGSGLIFRFRMFGLRSFCGASSNAEWKRAVEDLLTPKRGIGTDGVVFTQQTHAGIFCKAYRQTVGVEERRNILTHLISKYGHSSTTNVNLSKEMDDKWLADMTKLLKNVAPLYRQLFLAIGQLQGGIKFLVDLRADVLNWIREHQGRVLANETSGSANRLPTLKLMNVILRDLLSVWFSIGLLDVERVTWESPCVLLQRVAEYESVHPVRSWTDLKNRVGPGRRCFVFTHPAMPREPLVVLHIALMDRIPGKIKDVITFRRNESGSAGLEEDLSDATTAVFYSINSTQPGLQGIDLGHFLIKRVVQQLSAELPSINAFSTLSPIPGFRRWLMEEARRKARGQCQHKLFDPSELSLLNESLADTNRWYLDEGLQLRLQPILVRACAHYLLCVKHRGCAFDPVANFHLRNGAMLWRLNWKGDTSAKGLDQSCSLMVNYRYYLNQTDEFSRLYLEKKEIQVSEQVKKLLQPSHTSNL